MTTPAWFHLRPSLSVQRAAIVASARHLLLTSCITEVSWQGARMPSGRTSKLACPCSNLVAAPASAARRQAAKLCYRFGPLTPSARSANLIAGDGTKNDFPAPNKEPANKPKDYLTGNAPYRFESASLQRRVNELSVPLKTTPVARSHDLFAIEAAPGDSGPRRAQPLARRISTIRSVR